MKKIIIIGCPGFGKTTFAEKLQRVTNLPLYYLDAIWHKPDRTHISREEYDKVLPWIYELLAKNNDDKDIIIFKSRAEADEYLDRI